MKEGLFSLIKNRILHSSLAWIQSRMNINVAHLSQFYLPEISRKKRLENGFLSNCKCNWLKSLQGCWHLWKVTVIREIFLTGKRQMILPPSKRWERGSGEPQADQPHFSPQENDGRSYYESRSRHRKHQVMGNNQSRPIYQGPILPDHPDCHRGGNGWLCGRGETADVIGLAHSKAFNSVSHSSLVSGPRIWTTRREEKLLDHWTQNSQWFKSVRWLQATFHSQN